MVAFKSGACQGYALVSLQLILMAVLLLAQELTIRLGVHTGKSLTVLIKESYGPQVAWCFVIPLVLYCEAQAIEQFTGLMSVGKLWGVHPGGVLFGSATVVFGVGTMLRYEQVERFAIMIGLTQLIFVAAMFAMPHPDPATVATDLFLLRQDNRGFFRLVVANIGAVVMPFMLFFQQSAVVLRKIRPGSDESAERVHTAVGATLTQGVMIATITVAASFHHFNSRAQTDSFDSLDPVVNALSIFGPAARPLVSVAFIGAAVCALIVVDLTATWAVADAMDVQVEELRDSNVFVAAYGAILFVGAGIAWNAQLARYAICLESVGAALVLPVLYSLYAFASELDSPARLRGLHQVVCGAVFVVCALSALVTGFYGYEEREGTSCN